MKSQKQPYKRLLEAIDKFESKTFVPEPLDYSRHDVKGRWQACDEAS